MTDIIEKIRARHERVTDQLAARTTGIVYQEGRDAHADRATLLRALDEAKWQPIETAPKDGTCILIWDGHMCPATWSDCCDHGQFETAPGWQIFSCEDSWHSAAAYNPTYWMPLPEPPALKEKPQ
jgi:hypothetical protein